MLYKLVLLTLLVIVNVHNISADNNALSRQLLADDQDEPVEPADPVDPNQDDNGEDNGENNGENENENTEIDTQDDNNENTDENENDTTETPSADGDDNNATDEPSNESDESGENGSDDTSGDDTSGDDNSVDNSGDDNSGDDNSGDNSHEVENSGSDDADSEEDICIGLLTENECDEQVMDGGDKECGFNAEKKECYSIERRDGRYGSGNFDDGYNAAQLQSQNESAQLTTLIGVLGGIIGALILIIAGGAYWFYNNKNGHRKMSGIEMLNENDGQTLNVGHEEQMVINTVEDVSPVITKGNADSDPML